MTALLQVEHLRLQTRRTQRILIDDVTFALHQGERVALVGPPESGKTLLLKLLNRLIDPSDGKIYFQGQPLAQYPATQLRQQVMVVLAEASLLGMTVQEALRYPLHLQQLSATQQQDRLLTWTERLEIPSAWLSLRETDLSPRQRQWFVIARGLITQPKLLLLDRPLQYLESEDQLRLSQVLTQQTQDQGMGVMVVEGDWDWLVQWSTRCLHLQNGGIQSDASAPEIHWSQLEVAVDQISHEDDEEW